MKEYFTFMSKLRSVVFDIECGPTSGYGHLSRVLAIAEIMQEMNIECFIKSESQLTERGLQMMARSNIPHQIRMPARFDLQVVDRYTPKQNFKFANRIVQLVDQTSVDLEADAYISVSPTKNWSQKKKFHKPFLNDPPLRKSIARLATQQTGTQNERILFLSGGTNQSDLKNSIIDTLKLQASKLPIDILIDSSESIIDTKGTDVNLVYSRKGLLDAISNYDMVVSACGVSAWELIALKKRVCLFSLVENQEFQLNEMKKSGHCLTLEMSKDRLAFVGFVSKLQELKGWSAPGVSPIRLDGSRRIVEYIESVI